MPSNSSKESTSESKYIFDKELCDLLQIDFNVKYSKNEIKKKFKNCAKSIKTMKIIFADNKTVCNHTVYEFEDKLSEFINRMIVNKFGKSNKMVFINGVIMDAIDLYSDCSDDPWANFECATKKPKITVDSVEVMV